MNKLKERFENYLKKSSKWKIASDAFFYLFILLLLIPTTRKPISSTLIRLTMRNPPAVKEAEFASLNASDKSIQFTDLTGNRFSLGDFKGEVILLNFWATWCPPCRAEMPSIQSLYEDYGDKIAMILISSEQEEPIRKYLDEKGFTMPVYIQQTALTPNFPVSSIPTTYLINRKGEILYSKKGAANWNSDKFRAELDELIAQKAG